MAKVELKTAICSVCGELLTTDTRLGLWGHAAENSNHPPVPEPGTIQKWGEVEHGVSAVQA